MLTASGEMTDEVVAAIWKIHMTIVRANRELDAGQHEVAFATYNYALGMGFMLETLEVGEFAPLHDELESLFARILEVMKRVQ